MQSQASEWTSWLARWDAQQQRHIPDREERFTAIVDALAAFVGPEPRVLDLGCGPGSLSARVLQRLPGATVVAIDTDPVLLAIGRGALGANPRLTFLDTDLRSDWVRALPAPGPYDAAVSTTALHWLGLEQLVGLYGSLAGALRPGAIFLDGDRIDFDHDQAAIATGAGRVHPAWPDAPEGAEDYDAWWSAAVAEPALAAEVAERARRAHDHPHNDNPHSYEFHASALFAAGFAEVGTLWQHLANRVLVAVR
ncbi:MAG TPA: class I SAM-dependent methyltransferase [Candidatus Dormibacteraeota bacterium]|jgi:SAM-dependent methyltransferase